MIFNDIIYDIEVYPNVFTFSATHVTTLTRYRFEISFRRNDIQPLYDFILWCLNARNVRWVGYNNNYYDYPIVHWIFENIYNGVNAEDIYRMSMSIINSDRNDNSHVIWDPLIPQVDLYLIHHFNNKARSTSLKMLEFNMRSDNIEDLPFPVGTPLTSEQIDTLLIYNNHDVDETLKFYHESKSMIEFREKLNSDYGVNWTNKNDTAIGKSYFIKELEDVTPGVCYRQTLEGKKPNQTLRPILYLNDAVFDYIQFQRPEFQQVVAWLRKQEITETKGVFSNILEHDLGELAQYAELITKSKKVSLTCPLTLDSGEWMDYRKLKSGDVSAYVCHKEAKNLNTVINGFRFDFGTGGIHGSVDSQTLVSTPDRVIMDFDVKSYYPNLAIVNQLYPEHLGKLFCQIYKKLYDMRAESVPKSDINAMLKLALNGVYGDTNNVYSPFYDPLYTMRVTLNGQLLLCLLAEWLMAIPSLKMIQINTDGLTVEYDRTQDVAVFSTAKLWEEHTQLILEHVEYSRMFIRDVNSYIAEGVDGKIKRKGAYCYGKDLDWHQNHSNQIVPMAAEAVLLDGDDLDIYIRSHQNIFDFMGRTKVPRNSRLELTHPGKPAIPLQNITRYYASTEGGQLMKIMPPLPGKTEDRRIGVNAGQYVKPCNDITLASWHDIDYTFYISEAEKLIKPLIT